MPKITFFLHFWGFWGILLFKLKIHGRGGPPKIFRLRQGGGPPKILRLRQGGGHFEIFTSASKDQTPRRQFCHFPNSQISGNLKRPWKFKYPGVQENAKFYPEPLLRQDTELHEFETGKLLYRYTFFIYTKFNLQYIYWGCQRWLPLVSRQPYRAGSHKNTIHAWAFGSQKDIPKQLFIKI